MLEIQIPVTPFPSLQRCPKKLDPKLYAEQKTSVAVLVILSKNRPTFPPICLIRDYFGLSGVFGFSIVFHKRQAREVVVNRHPLPSFTEQCRVSISHQLHSNATVASFFFFGFAGEPRVRRSPTCVPNSQIAGRRPILEPFLDLVLRQITSIGFAASAFLDSLSDEGIRERCEFHTAVHSLLSGMPDFLSFVFDPGSSSFWLVRMPTFAVLTGDRLVQEYEDYDDYEEDGGEQEEEYEEEEEEDDPKPSKEQLEFLEYRQRRKERLRKEKMKKEGPSASQDKKKLPYDNYGSFFGPSKPVIAQRVIQESKSLLENQHLATRVLQSQYKNQKSSPSTSMGSRPVVRDKIPKGINMVNHKVQKLKDTRDYSFLFSDDAELPASAKQPPSRNTSAPTSETRPAKMPLPSKQASGSNGRIPHNVRDDRRPSSMNGQTNSRPGATKLSSTTKSNSMLAADKRLLHSTNRNGPGQHAMTNGLQQKKPLAIMGRKTSQVAKISTPVMSKPLAAKIPSPALKHNVQQRKDVGNPNKYNSAPKKPVASIKPQMNKPPKQISSAVKSLDQKPKKKPRRPFSDDEDDGGGIAIDMIRKMFRYNPNHYAGQDDDDSDMEANFDEIMKEEKRSAKIARKEDEEQQRLIEEEERREEMRKMARKRKLSH
ncbi:uncharacterized protein J3R85_005143 [Psidium guajava]|nr:uncharacterized protein J3R85_005143 [Psidium guajava]